AHGYQRPRAVDLVDEYRTRAAGPAGAGFVDHLRPRERKPEFAGLHRVDRSGRPPRRWRTQLVQWLDASALSRHRRAGARTTHTKSRCPSILSRRLTTTESGFSRETEPRTFG